MSDNDPITYREYRQEIKSLADTVIEEQEHYDDTHENVFHTIDGHQWHIYYDYNIQVLRHTEPDEWKHLVGDNDSWKKVLQAMAFSGMRQDLYDELHDREDFEL